jgi:hypothetical protein
MLKFRGMLRRRIRHYEASIGLRLAAPQINLYDIPEFRFFLHWQHRLRQMIGYFINPCPLPITENDCLYCTFFELHWPFSFNFIMQYALLFDQHIEL